MNNFFEQFKQSAGEIRLSKAEKARMRESLYAAMGTQKTASPYFSFFPISALLSVRSLVPLVVVCVVLVSSGTAYAAAGSLPGDLLYPVKVSVNERVEVALATTQAQKMGAEVRLAKRRVAEAQALEAKGTLDAATTEKLEKAFDRHASNALSLSAVPAETPQPTIAEDEVVSLKSAVSVVNSATTSEATNATATAIQPDADDDVRESLQEQKEVLRALKLRIESRGRGEVRGASTENRGRGTSGGKNKND
ncbi:MAG: DUF5667 domain-containing protein [Patescibacteria group bacterium]